MVKNNNLETQVKKFVLIWSEALRDISTYVADLWKTELSWANIFDWLSKPKRAEAQLWQIQQGASPPLPCHWPAGMRFKIAPE